MNANKNSLKSLQSVLALVVALVAGPLFAASGQFTFVTGDVRVVTAGNRTVAATRGMDLNPGDVVVTGADGMAQLTMVDAARLSLRSNTQMRIESYAQKTGGGESSILNLLSGTLRTFTSLLSPSSRDKFQMKTRVATVGIRGSGGLLFYCETNCPSDPGQPPVPDNTTFQHTIEGSHCVATVGQETECVVTGPGDTLQINAGAPPKFVSAPSFLLNSGYNMTGGSSGKGATTTTEDSRNSGSVDSKNADLPSLPNLVGGNGLGFPVTSNIGQSDPLGLQDVIVAGGVVIASQATRDGLTLDTTSLRGFNSYAGLQSGLSVSVSGGTLADPHTLTVGDETIYLGRWDGGNLSVQGGAGGASGSVHWAYAGAGYPSYLSEVLTGTATYTLAAATQPTNQSGVGGTLGSATLDVNFTNRTLNAALAVAIPAGNGNAGGNWNLNASSVPFTLNSFFATTSDRLVVTNGSGASSATNPALFGEIDGSFVGNSLAAAILGYGFVDQTPANASNFNIVSGVAALTGPPQSSSAPFRDGLVSDASGVLANFAFIRNFATTDRPDEVTQGASGAVSAFAAPYFFAGQYAGHSSYQQGTATATDTGSDPTTGLSWGRWSGGAASVSSGGNTQNIALTNTSLHYIFGASQTGPVALSLTGSAAYDVIGSTHPTDAAGHVGTFNSASLAANFTNRTVDLGLNFTINNQTWNAGANNVPIYRDEFFSAFAGPAIPGIPSPAQLTIACTPSCGTGATGAVDGFFTGRSGQGAGMLYSVGGASGAVAMGRRGGP
jgi:hypothetical protein